MRAALLVAILACSSGCSSPPSPDEVLVWREAERGALEAQPAAPADLDALRAAGDLRAARTATLRALLAEETPALLWRMARAEADLVHVLRSEGAERRERDVAASSGLRYAQEAKQAAGSQADADLLGQLAYSLGTTTHLEPMFDRDQRALETQRAIQAALAADPAQVLALLTRATLHLRLETLPWIAKLFAGDAPDPDLALAEEAARACVARLPSREHRLILAKLLAERGAEGEALEVARAAADAADAYPRDRELRAAARDLVAALE